MIGVSVPNTQLDKFHDALEQGQMLMMIDTPKARVGEIGELVKSHHPDAHIEGTEDPTYHVFP